MDKQNGFVFANLPYKFNSYNSNVENVIFEQEKLFFIINYSTWFLRVSALKTASVLLIFLPFGPIFQWAQHLVELI